MPLVSKRGQLIASPFYNLLLSCGSFKLKTTTISFVAFLYIYFQVSLSIVGSNSTRNLSPICTEGSAASRSDSSADGSSNSGLLVSYMYHFTIVSRFS